MRFEHEVVYFPSQMLVVGQLVVAVAFGSVLGRDQVPDQIYEVAVFDNVDLSVLALLALQPDLDERLFALDPLVEADLEDVLFYELSQRLLPLGVHETASGRCLHVIWFVQRFEHLEVHQVILLRSFIGAELVLGATAVGLGMLIASCPQDIERRSACQRPLYGRVKGVENGLALRHWSHLLVLTLEKYLIFFVPRILEEVDQLFGGLVYAEAQPCLGRQLLHDLLFVRPQPFQNHLSQSVRIQQRVIGAILVLVLDRAQKLVEDLVLPQMLNEDVDLVHHQLVVRVLRGLLVLHLVQAPQTGILRVEAILGKLVIGGVSDGIIPVRKSQASLSGVVLVGGIVVEDRLLVDLGLVKHVDREVELAVEGLVREEVGEVFDLLVRVRVLRVLAFQLQHLHQLGNFVDLNEFGQNHFHLSVFVLAVDQIHESVAVVIEFLHVHRGSEVAHDPGLEEVVVENYVPQRHVLLQDLPHLGRIPQGRHYDGVILGSDVVAILIVLLVFGGLLNLLVDGVRRGFLPQLLFRSPLGFDFGLLDPVQPILVAEVGVFEDEVLDRVFDLEDVVHLELSLHEGQLEFVVVDQLFLRLLCFLGQHGLEVRVNDPQTRRDLVALRP